VFYWQSKALKMSDTPLSDRPRRTRQSTARASATPASYVSSTPNPYKRPTYLAAREKESPVVSSSNGSNSTPSRGGRRGRGRPRGGGSARGRPSRPECVANRIDGRRKTNSRSNSATRAPTRGKNKRRGGYNTHDYHYGSDFESEEEVEESEPEVEPDSDSDAASVEDVDVPSKFTSLHSLDRICRVLRLSMEVIFIFPCF